MKRKYKKTIILILGIFMLQSCVFMRYPDAHPLIVTSIRQSSEPEYDIYLIKDTNPHIQGCGDAAMFIELKDKRGKFKMGDTIVFNKK
jgi:hypothetical protein